MDQAQDAAKLHAEINQYINQCFVISMTAITVFGVVGGWIVAGFTSSSSPGGLLKIGPMTFLLSGFLSILLFVLFFVYQLTINNILFIATYLRLKNMSVWEADYEQLRPRRRRLKWLEQANARMLLFFVLGVATLFLPIVLLPFSSSQGGTAFVTCFIIHCVISGSFCIAVVSTWQGKAFRFRKDEVEELWKEILPAEPSKAPQPTGKD